MTGMRDARDRPFRQRQVIAHEAMRDSEPKTIPPTMSGTPLANLEMVPARRRMDTKNLIFGLHHFSTQFNFIILLTSTANVDALAVCNESVDGPVECS